MIEMLIVITMIGVLTMIAVPKFRVYRDRSNVQAVRARVEGMLATARASAIHKGRLSIFGSSGNWMAVWTQNPTTGAWEQQVPWQNIGQAFPNVQLQYGGAGWNYVYYEPRGLTWASARPPSTLVFRVVGLTRTDSVCVSRFGQILPRGCTL
jgi:Tfp pilus assembly protein FimT